VASVGFDLRFGFGVSRSDGVYFDVSADDDLEVFFEVEIASFDATGQLLFLQLDADTLDWAELSDDAITKSGGDPGNPSAGVFNAFRGGFIIDITDPSGDGKLTLAELATVSDFGQILDASLDARASIHLDLLASMGGSTNFPSVGARLHLYWVFGDTTDYELVAPAIEFTNVRLNMGEFFSDFFGSTLSTINDVVEPIKPVLDVLTTPIPVLSDLAGSPVRLVDLARLFGSGAETVADVIEVIDIVVDLLAMPTFGDELYIDFGGFTLADFDPRTQNVRDYNLTPADFDDQASGFNIGNAVAAVGDSNLSNYFGAVQSATGQSVGGPVPPGDGNWLEFPILNNPMSVFQLLLGKQDVVLVTLDIPRLEVEFSYSQYFPIVGPLGCRITGTIGAAADFAFGFDTQGLFDAFDSGDWTDVFNGFYISDRANPDGTGEDVPEIELWGGLRAAAEVNLVVVSAGVAGGIDVVIEMNLNDPNNDGKVRIGELVDNFLLGPIWIFDIGGRVDAILEAYIKIDLFFFSFEETFEIASVTLVDFELPRPDPDPAPPTAALANVTGGVMTVNVGTNAAARLHGDLSDGDDNVILERGYTPDEVVVKAFGLQQRYQGVTHIEVYAGEGHDIVTVNDNVDQEVLLDGGPGNDVLTTGDGHSVIRGGEGNDRLYGGDGDDELYGDAGDDVLSGGFGNDRLEGGDGHDELDGSLGDDELFGGADDDLLVGGPDDDMLDGGEGDDQLHGGRNNDHLLGGAGEDHLYLSLIHISEPTRPY